MCAFSCPNQAGVHTAGGYLTTSFLDPLTFPPNGPVSTVTSMLYVSPDLAFLGILHEYRGPPHPYSMAPVAIRLPDRSTMVTWGAGAGPSDAWPFAAVRMMPEYSPPPAPRRE
jgi:hypothetical protein